MGAGAVGRPAACSHIFNSESWKTCLLPKGPSGGRSRNWNNESETSWSWRSPECLVLLVPEGDATGNFPGELSL